MQKKVNQPTGENNSPSLNPSRPQFGSECLGRVCLQWKRKEEAEEGAKAPLGGSN